ELGSDLARAIARNELPLSHGDVLLRLPIVRRREPAPEALNPPAMQQEAAELILVRACRGPDELRRLAESDRVARFDEAVVDLHLGACGLVRGLERDDALCVGAEELAEGRWVGERCNRVPLAIAARFADGREHLADYPLLETFSGWQPRAHDKPVNVALRDDESGLLPASRRDVAFRD